MKNNDKKLWTARSFQTGDENGLKILYENVHSRPFDQPVWQWQFQNAVKEPGYIWLADHDGTLAGQYATIPVRLQLAGEEIKGALSLDTMTGVEYRKQGIFISLAKNVYDELKSNGVKLIYGFPNDNSYHGFIKYLDFFVLQNLPGVTRPLNMPALLLKKIGNRLISKLAGAPIQALFDLIFSTKRIRHDFTIEKKEEFPLEVNQLFSSLSAEYKNLIIRDHRYLHWRYDQNPKHSYVKFFAYRQDKLVGYCVCGQTEREGLKIGLIVDIFTSAADQNLAAALIQNACDHFRTEHRHYRRCIPTLASRP